MDPRIGREAVMEAQLDEAEGADLPVKPPLPTSTWWLRFEPPAARSRCTTSAGNTPWSMLNASWTSAGAWWRDHARLPTGRSQRHRHLPCQRDFERGCGGAGMIRDVSTALHAEANTLVGGVNSPVRLKSVHGEQYTSRTPRGDHHRRDGNTLVDFVQSWGPLIHGHAHPNVLKAVTKTMARGTSYGAPHIGEIGCPEGQVDLR